MRTASLILLATPALAFVPASVPQQRSSVMMSAEKANIQGAVMRSLAAAGMLFSFSAPLSGVPSSAIAAAGEGPKQSVFGIGGDAASSPFVADVPTYSPYSPYGTGEDALFKPLNADDVKFFKGKVSESAKRLGKIDGYLEKKQWEEVRAELSRQMYDFRRSALKLAEAKGTPDAKEAAKKVFEDIEKLQVAARRKLGAEANAASKAVQADLDAFLKSI